nr:GTPase IMAP family member 7-like [Labrus bergylta]
MIVHGIFMLGSSFVKCCKIKTLTSISLRQSHYCLLESTKRVVVLGKTGAGKSSLVNTIFEETVFKTDSSAKSGTTECQAENKCVNGRRIMWIDTPGFFDTDRAQEEMKPEILRCIIECAPGPHVFLILLKVEKFTKHEQEVIDEIQKYFSEEALKFAIVVFSHGDQLPEEMKIEEFVEQCEYLRDLVKKCGGRCHVVDNKYWKTKEQDEYRANQFQVEELLKTIDKLIEENKGGCFTTERIQAAVRDKQQEQENIRRSSANKSTKEIIHMAKTEVLAKHMFKFADVTTGALLGAFIGGAMKLMRQGTPTAALVAGVAIGTAAGVLAGVAATSGATAEEPTSPGDAVEK